MSMASIPARGSILATRLRTARSSCSWPTYLARPANQRDAHGLLIPSRNPIGWTLRPMPVPLSTGGAGPLLQNDGDVRRAAQNRLEAAARPKTAPTPRRALVGPDPGDDQLVGVQAE